MTEQQFEQIIRGAEIAHNEDLHRLGSLLNAVLSVSLDASEGNLATLYDWAAKVGGDLVAHKAKTS